MPKEWRGAGPSVARGLVLWTFLFAVCLGLGYPTLNRYDPRVVGNTDAAEYYRMVVGSPQDATRHWRYRVLTPYLAKPIYLLAQGRVGTWDSVAVGMLVANALFTASAAFLLVGLAAQVTGNYSVGLLAALTYLLNFVVANEYLAGLVDAGEGFCLMVMARTLLAERWWPLPILAVLGVLEKETFLVLGGMFAGAWWLTLVLRDGLRARLFDFAWVVGFGFAGVAMVPLTHWLVSGVPMSPLQVAGYAASRSGYLEGIARALTDRSFWYIFGWLLPLGLPGLGRVRCLPWVLASVAAALVALHLGAYSNSGGTVARAMFSTAGPVLSVGVVSILIALGGARGRSA